jgi:hypothetical protein
MIRPSVRSRHHVDQPVVNILLKLVAALLVAGAAGFAQAQSRLIAELAPGANPSSLGAKYHVTLLDRSVASPFVLYGTTSGQDAGAIQLQMQSDPGFLWVEDDDTVVTPETTSKGGTIGAIVDRQALYSQNSHVLSQIHWSSANAYAAGRVVKIAVLDTGLGQKQTLLWNKTVNYFNAVEPGQVPYDRPLNQDTNGNGVVDEGAGHGTMVAGIIDQIAPKCPLVIVRIADSDGNSTAWRVIKGLTYAVAVGAEVANVSLGSSNRIPALTNILDWTDQKGLVVCAPLGNNNQKLALFPAAIGNVVSVAGVDSQDKKASFSNWEGLTMSCAPATGIKSYWWDGSMGIWSGTSFAGPFVAGAIADSLRKTNSRVAPSAIRNTIKPSGDVIDGLNPAYKSMLGTRLNVGSLQSKIKAASTQSGGSP